MKPDYKFSQSALYAISDLVATSLEEDLAAFTAFKGKYVQSYVDDFRTAILAAEALPDEQQRNSLIEVARIQLDEDYLRPVLNYWQDLKRYIADAFPQNIQKPKLEEAGWLLYPDAANLNWDKARALAQAGRTFITVNSAALLANDNMPAGFPAAYNAAANTLNTRINTFFQLRDNKAQATNAKIAANNAIYATINSITLDGQQIFRNDEAKRAQFVVDTLKEIVDGPGTSGVRGYVKDSVTENPISGVTVSLVNQDKSTPSQPDGRYQILHASGTYTLRFEATGYQTLDQIIEIPTGHLTSVTVLLLPV